MEMDGVSSKEEVIVPKGKTLFGVNLKITYRVDRISDTHSRGSCTL